MALKEMIHSYGTDRSGRASGDFYATRPQDVLALLEHEPFPGAVWEPACGDGAISRVIEGRGSDVVSTDLVDRGFGVGGINFLSELREVDHVVTNPPYLLAERFVHHALGCARRKVAMLLRLQFLEGKRRKAMFQTTPIARVYVFSNRIGFTKNGVPHDGGLVSYAWYVWDKSHSGDPTLRWINSEALTEAIWE